MLHASLPAGHCRPFALVLVLVLVLACCLAACGGAKPAQDATAPSSSASASDRPSGLSAAADAGATSAGASSAGASSVGANSGGSPSSAAGASGGSSNPGSPANVGSGSPSRPTATTATEATSLIDDAITSRQKEIGRCVAEARKRRKNAHAEVVLEIGIDQEGKLIGVKSPKSASPDPALNECVLGALKDAPFPRSKAGVITVKKNFSDQVVYP